MLADPVESVDSAGGVNIIERGDHLHVRVRPEAPVQLLLTGHMDTVFAVDHPFQTLKWLEDGVLNGPGTADMKAGISRHSRRADCARSIAACKPRRI